MSVNVLNMKLSSQYPVLQDDSQFPHTVSPNRISSTDLSLPSLSHRQTTGFPIPKVVKEGLLEKDVNHFAAQFRDLANRALSLTLVVLSGRDIKTSGAVGATAYFAYKLSNILSPLTLLYLGKSACCVMVFPCACV